MKAVFIMGSARVGGNTDMLCKSAADALADRGVNVSVFHPFTMNVSHCTNCGGCDRTGTCILDDDMSKIYKAVEKSNIIVFCTPVHFSGVSSIMKQVLDRFQCFWIKPRKAEKKIVGLICTGGSDPSYFKNIISVSKAVANTLNAEWGGELTISGTDKKNGVSKEQVLEAYGFGYTIYDRFRLL